MGLKEAYLNLRLRLVDASLRRIRNQRERYEGYLKEINQPTTGFDLSYEFVLLLTLRKIEDKITKLEDKRSGLVARLKDSE